jgi:CheY-like chemotaxis protein
MWKDQAQRHGIHIQISKDLKATEEVEGIAAELREVLSNIILNSIDALSESGSISFSTYQNESKVYVQIVDSGAGMPEEVRKRIFDPFFTTKGKRGTGLGLSVAYGIISRHKGDIEVKSTQEKGTIITISLPKAVKSTTILPESSVKELNRKLRILVIDDDENIRGILNDILSMDGHQVQEAESGPKGVDLLQSDSFDVIITDLGMPVMSGWDVAKLSKQHNPNLPVVLISGWGGQIDPQRLKESQVDFMLGKPFNLDQVKALIGQVVQKQAAVELATE